MNGLIEIRGKKVEFNSLKRVQLNFVIQEEAFTTTKINSEASILFLEIHYNNNQLVSRRLARDVISS